MRTRIFGLLFCLALALPATVNAGGIRSWIGVDEGWSTYRMSDMNADIGSVNTRLAAMNLHPMTELKHGGGRGVTLGLEFPKGFSIGASYGQLRGSSEARDTSGTIKYDMPGNAFRAFGQYSLRLPHDSDVHFGLSWGTVSAAGSASSTILGVASQVGDAKGSGTLLEEYFGAGWWVRSRLGIDASAGYRYAKISKYTINDAPVHLSTGERVSCDYSGVFVRAGVRIALTR